MGEISLRDENGRFVKGHTGNPKGRPPGLTVYGAVQKLLGEKHAMSGRLMVDEVAQALLAKLLEADPAALALVVNREDPIINRNLNMDVASFEQATDRFISDMMATPEGEERLAAMQREAWQEMAPAPPEGPPNDLVREDGSIE